MPVRWRETHARAARARRRPVRRGRAGQGPHRPGQADAARRGAGQCLSRRSGSASSVAARARRTRFGRARRSCAARRSSRSRPSCPRASSRAPRSPRGSASPRTGSCRAPASGSAGGPRPDERLSDYADPGRRARRSSARGVGAERARPRDRGHDDPGRAHAEHGAARRARARRRRAPGAIDVGAACTAFLSGLALGAAQIESGRAERILLVGADFITRITDYDDKAHRAAVRRRRRARSCSGAADTADARRDRPDRARLATDRTAPTIIAHRTRSA